jgi:CBS domain containing-hemolysin-like protein
MPIYGQGRDDITGKVIRGDLFEAERNGQGGEPIKRFARDILRVSEKLPVQKLLDLFIKHHMHLCLVEDEFGQPAGIVTLEDAIETVLGREIMDERDTVADMQALARGRYRERLRAEKTKDDG